MIRRDNNTFHVINQWTVIGHDTKHPDIVVFVDGVSLVTVELKSCMNKDAGIENSYKQLRNYMKTIPSLFVSNAFCIISDLTETKVKTISSDFDRYAAWKTINGDYEETKYAQYNLLFERCCNRTDYLIYCIILFCLRMKLRMI